MKKLHLLFFVLMTTACLSACANSKEINGTHFVEFETIFINGLPDEVEDIENCHNMYLEKRKSILGDPNYVISFTLKFDNLSAYQNHLQGINTTLAEELQTDGKTYYLFQGSKEELIEYTNLEILDGYFFVYEIIATNKQTREVDYLYAYVWDYWKNEFLISKLDNVFGHVA